MNFLNDYYMPLLIVLYSLPVKQKHYRCYLGISLLEFQLQLVFTDESIIF